MKIGLPSAAAYQAFLEAVEGRIAAPRKSGSFRPGMQKALEDGLQLVSQAQLAAGDTSAWRRVVESMRAFSVPDRVAAEAASDKAMADYLTFLPTH